MTAPAATPEPHRPIFVVGSNGSGSTLLRLMLDSHERIAIPEETGFLRLAMTHEWVPYWPLGNRWHESLGLTDAQMYAAVADFYGGLFASYAAARGKVRWGDKTPFHVWHLELASRLYPEAIVIGIIRHPGGAVASMRRRFRRSIPSGTTHWMRTTRRLLLDAEKLGDRCVLLRYEDLVVSPEPVMRALLARLDEPWSDAVLAHHEVQPSAEAVGFTRTDRPIDTSSVSEWESQLRGAPREQMVGRTAVLARFLGYDPEHAVPIEPLGSPDVPFLLDGIAIAARRASRGEGIDWTRPRAAPENRPMRPPAPRPKRTAAPPSLDNVTIRKLLAHRLRGRFSPEARKQAHDLRRSKPWLDRLWGPR